MQQIRKLCAGLWMKMCPKRCSARERDLGAHDLEAAVGSLPPGPTAPRALDQGAGAPKPQPARETQKLSRAAVPTPCKAASSSRPLPFSFTCKGQNFNVGLLAFYFSGKEEDWDRLCRAGFLGNFYPLPSDEHILLRPPHRQAHAFANAEAAFQALKFWERASEFTTLPGKEAFQKKKSLEGHEDFTYAGFGSNWKGMRAVLESKFRLGTRMARLLDETGDSYLLEHNPQPGRDGIWSDGHDGEGSNWLGLQLMLVREKNRKAQPPFWTGWLQQHVILETGAALGNEWQATVRKAVGALKESLQARRRG